MKSKSFGFVVVLATSLCACTARNPKFCGDGTCDDPSLPFCDIDGSLEGTPGTCIAVSCTAGSFVSCRGDDTLVCNATGDDYDIMHCDTGCKVGITTCNPCRPGDVTCGTNAVETCGEDGLPHVSETCDVACVASPSVHCAYLEPKYLPNICDSLATDPSLTVLNSTTLSTDLDANCNGGVVAQDGGPELCILRYGTIAIATDISVTAVGARALVLVADASLDINGIIDVSSSGTNGPGGGIGNAGTGTSGAGTPGGGGGGFATPGGSGGGGLSGGSASTNPALLTALIGGASGGNGNSRGAGGAVALIACRGTVSVAGLINAGGGGGTALTAAPSVGARGGGSGGNVVVQGLAVSVVGSLYANGGGGGEGVAGGSPGQNGQLGTNAALGGGTGASRGGDGGTRTSAPASGAAANGAGGGSVGFLQTYTPMGVTPTLTPSVVSPALQPNLTVLTR